ncbi:hypothetical protein F4604DRAFT_1932782 [Suillus subluteus]|nr:hypothetical protein F4604DRAFT_1932782 [Suillus subluteus]
MEPPSSPSSTITAPPDNSENHRRLAKMIVEAMACSFALLHYDSASKSMVQWSWPADEHGLKVPPSDLEKYRNEYELRFPCCLCADGSGREAYVEAVIYSWWDEAAQRTYWTTRCASSVCGYRVVQMDTYSWHEPLAAFRYPRRVEEISRIKLEWSSTEQTELLNKLESSGGDGITVKEFRVLFKWCTKCRRCIGPSSPLLNTWATVDVQEALYSAFCAEQACQASLLSQPYLAKSAHSQRNISLELIILQSKMNHAQAEISLYTVAIGNAHKRDFPDMTGKMLFSDRYIPPPQPDKLCYYDHNIDDEANDCDDFEF